MGGGGRCYIRLEPGQREGKGPEWGYYGREGRMASHGSGSRREGRGKLQLEHGQGGEGGRDEEFTSEMTPREGWSLGPTKI